MKKLTYLLVAAITLCLPVLSMGGNPVSAANAANWQAGSIISDAIFTDPNAMSVAQIQEFLNQKVGTGGYGRIAGQCDTNGVKISEFGGGTRADYGASKGNPAPFTCLKDYYEVPKLNPGPETPASNYGGAPIPPGAKSAAQLIWDAAQRYNISPKVLLVTIQKESAGPLITDDWPFRKQYTYAMGAHCPDSGPGGSANCDPNYAGFSIQISESAELLRYYLDNMQQSWWPYKKLGNNSILYNPNAACGSSTVNITTKATAALYTYTPYQPNTAALNNLYGSGDSCSAYGNRNFWRMYTDWFGSTQTTIPYAWNFTSSNVYIDSARTTPYTPGTTLSINPGAKAYVTLQVRNNGNQAWAQSQTRLGTSGPRDRTSGFSDNSWTNPARIALNDTAVDPGDVGTFRFSFTAPQTSGSYRECFDVVVEGISWMQGPGVCYDIDVVTNQDNNNDQDIVLNSGQSISTGSYLMSPSAQSVLLLQTDGNLVLYSNTVPRWNSSTSGTKPNRLLMQTDGNLVLYDQANQAVWHSGTPGNSGARAIIQSDGNLVIYNGTTPIWSTGTHHVPSYSNTVLRVLRGGVLYPQQSLQTANRSRMLIMQRDGNLVLYSGGQPIWATFTQGNPGAYAIMQADGNFVIYSKNNRPLWATYTVNSPGSVLVLQDDGNLVLYGAGSRPLWHTQTHGR